MLTLDERRTKQYERIGRAWDVSRPLPASRLGVVVGVWLLFRRENVGVGRLKRGGIVVCEGGGCNVGSELDYLWGRFDRGGPLEIEM